MDALAACGVGIIGAAAVLWPARRSSTGRMPLDEIAGKIAIQSVPMQLRRDDRAQAIERRRRRARGRGEGRARRRLWRPALPDAGRRAVPRLQRRADRGDGPDRLYDVALAGCSALDPASRCCCSMLFVYGSASRARRSGPPTRIRSRTFLRLHDPRLWHRARWSASIVLWTFGRTDGTAIGPDRGDDGGDRLPGGARRGDRPAGGVRRRWHDEDQGETPPLLEWIASAIGLLLILRSLAVIARDAFNGSAGMTPDDRGRGRPASSRARAGFMRRDSRRATCRRSPPPQVDDRRQAVRGRSRPARATIDYVPGHSARRGGLFFAQDPRGMPSCARSAIRTRETGPAYVPRPRNLRRPDRDGPPLRRRAAAAARGEGRRGGRGPRRDRPRDARDGAVRPLHPRGIWRARPDHGGGGAGRARIRADDAGLPLGVRHQCRDRQPGPGDGRLATRRRPNGCRGSPAARSSPASR